MGSIYKNLTLTPGQIDFYKENGYLLFRKLFDLSTLDTYRRRVTQICNKEIPFSDVLIYKDKKLMTDMDKKIPEDYVGKINSVSFDDVLSTYSEDPKLLDIVCQLIGDDVTLMNSMVLNKPPGSGSHPPHQDAFFVPIESADQFLNTWTAIDLATQKTGCLFLVPGSHKPNQLYPEYHVPDFGKLFFEIEHSEKVAPLEKRVYLEMEPGDTLIIHGLLVHGSQPNTSQQYRKAISSGYANSRCTYKTIGRVKGQEEFVSIYNASLKKYGFDSNFLEHWKAKAKYMRGVKSHL